MEVHSRLKVSLPWELSPVEELSITVRADPSAATGAFDVEWLDARCRPSTSDADVSRSVTPVACTDGAKNLAELLRILQRITFGAKSPVDKDGLERAARRGQTSLMLESEEVEDVTLCLQHRTERAKVQRVVATTDNNGDLRAAVFYTGGTVVGRDVHASGFLRRLSSMFSSECGWQLVRPVAWNELPSELWWHVMKHFTAKEGKALACTCKAINSITKMESFFWIPSELHLAIVSAQEAVRADNSTHLPVNIAEAEVHIGRSRNNDVVLLRDPEVSKRHCRLWRDGRGTVFVQDLASTNGTWLNGDWLRPPGVSSCAQRDPGDRTASVLCPRSEVPFKLAIGDTLVLGLTTLALKDGPCPAPPAAAVGEDAEGEDRGAGNAGEGEGGGEA